MYQFVYNNFLNTVYIIMQCVAHDDQGIKVSEGKWSAFTGEIDGYQHDGMHDEVLRLQRYQLDYNESAEDEEYAYVLDAVIESAVVE